MQRFSKDTQSLILDAALHAFHKHGLKGARTDRIAAAAGISRTMLHYYFNTKEALYEAVLNKTFGSILPFFNRLIEEKKDIFELLEHLVASISDMLEANPGLPSFIVNILNENPELILNITDFQAERSPNELEKALENARQMGMVRDGVHGEDLMINIWAMCSTPYLLAPYIAAKENRDAAAMRQFIRDRRKSILQFIRAGIEARIN